ncbi:ergothioneine biosynthesis glutamate--cysteine ligase EgtA [Mycobacteroides abscessus]|uniref:ergothioneine biosynthesis glutamate--cysteine ligase EgtA n=1 Tax=Mycobacteroides abscessus TaxID=36809 RepID=UPI000448DA35|nr:ergothioneine biosynthesis glutamate--cysteine ligase EgtA [Mycobacteroides abscessus]ETZ63923.1 ergothioneine biosynthesis glutamate--cysteine ligase EgtA [Mycobacteroides abscessus MAB_110811_2726]EUA72999.1 ergothioneine biosynthesis glutamate--cysteine ligase EgtA [Mycobacteroides abscessus]MDM1918121.1 ergothioneine biosynthesis glutamate--cysteine ligase EgtA [Mycobacteroides abscessus]MDM1927112.1 ergothioneine biosynthesis glutamate--cysteine ligase EgtA [Mycobacteroides abscessus]M
MATTATEADTGRTLSGHDEAAEHIARQAFADAQVGAVGLELESHTVELTAPHRRITWNRLREVGDSVPDLPGSSAITFEPGGAVELSGPPCSDVWSAISSMRADHEILTAVYRGAGIALASLGTDPLRRPERVNPGARYVAMERHFGAAGYGETALQMMTCTASLQVNVQSGTPRQWRDRFVLAQRIGPTMAALSASSPMLTSRPTGRRNTRQWIWDNLDPRRCAPVEIGVDPTESWVEYALRAPVMLVRNKDGADAVVTRVPFQSWVDGTMPLAGRAPTTEDLDYHLTTLFPPVRPRRWLELRYLDAAPDWWWPALAFTAVAALDDPQVADIAAEIAEPVGNAWGVAARIGLEDPALHAAAHRLVSAACAVAPPELATDMEFLLERVEQGRCPADDFIDNVTEYGVEKAFSGAIG